MMMNTMKSYITTILKNTAMNVLTGNRKEYVHVDARAVFVNML